MIRTITNADLDIIIPWYREHDFPDVREALPTLGYVFTIDDQLYAACFVYEAFDNTACWIGWMVTNPANDPKQSYTYLKTLLKKVKDLMLAKGVKMIIAPATGGRAGVLLSAGFKYGETTNLMIGAK